MFKVFKEVLMYLRSCWPIVKIVNMFSKLLRQINPSAIIIQ
jgi:hypothetical protein